MNRTNTFIYSCVIASLLLACNAKRNTINADESTADNVKEVSITDSTGVAKDSQQTQQVFRKVTDEKNMPRQRSKEQMKLAPDLREEPSRK